MLATANNPNSVSAFTGGLFEILCSGTASLQQSRALSHGAAHAVRLLLRGRLPLADLTPGQPSGKCTASENRNYRHALGNEKVGREKASGQKILPFEFHFPTIYIQESPNSKRSKVIAGARSGLVQRGRSSPSLRSLRISTSCRRATDNSP